MSVPNTNTFSLNDVRNELGLGSTASLQDCIDNATESGYDTTYYTAPATSQLEFRNYEEPSGGNNLKVTPTVISTDANSATIGITVTSNTTWSVTDTAAWITTSVGTGSGSGSFNVSLSLNGTGSPRSGSVTVSTSSGSPSISRTITVNQGSGFE